MQKLLLITYQTNSNIWLIILNKTSQIKIKLRHLADCARPYQPKMNKNIPQ